MRDGAAPTAVGGGDDGHPEGQGGAPAGRAHGTAGRGRLARQA